MIIVREARKSDLNDIKLLGWKLEKYEKKYDSLFDLSEKTKKTYFRWLNRCFKNKNFKFFVVLNNNQLMGFAFGQITKAVPVYKVKRMGYIWHIIVEKQIRDKGIGKRLLKRLENWFKYKGLKYVELDAVYKNKKIVKIWEHLGYDSSWIRMRKKL